jgi:hypothetical protein
VFQLADARCDRYARSGDALSSSFQPIPNETTISELS